MSIEINKGFSISLGFHASDGPEPLTDVTTMLTNVLSGDTGSVRLVYPDPTAGVAVPIRSFRVDAIGGTGANISARYTSPSDGSIKNLATLITVTMPFNSGSVGFDPPGPQFKTPA